MSYTALYRKFRPDCFDDVKGQDAIVTTLKNQIKAGRIGHAYLFSGTRGTGKTTVAKILAKVVNCENPVNGNPCNICKTCLAISSQSSMNVIEIDAASNNGVDNIREIVEEVRYSPTTGKFKVYIVDEVHMLSAGAFNALLKTLEEPPAYVVFILATTEVHKIPITILSRCQKYEFKRISVNHILERLRELITKEQVEAEEKALRYVARAADGALRDALSLLDQCISFYLGQPLTYDKVLEVLGTVDIEVFAKLLRYIRKGDVGACAGLLEEIINTGRDLMQFTLDFTWYLRNLMLLQTIENASDLLEFTSDQMDLMTQESEACALEQLIRYLRIFSDVSNQLRFAGQKRVILEITLVKLCHPEMETDYNSLINRLKKLEDKIADGNLSQLVQKQVISISEQDERMEADSLKGFVQKAQEPLPKAINEDLKQVAQQWNSILLKMSPLVRTVLISARPTIGEDNKLLLLFDNQVDKELIDQEIHIKDISTAIAKVIEREVFIQTKLIGKETSLESYPDLTKIIKNIPIEYID